MRPSSWILLPAFVVQRDLNVNSGYAVHDHERIVKESVAEARADLERAHQAEVDALRTRIAALTEPEWDKHTVEAVQEALKAKDFDRAEALMEGMEKRPPCSRIDPCGAEADPNPPVTRRNRAGE